MKVRGITVLARRVLVTREFGTDAWAAFYGDLARSQRCFQSFITSSSLIPLSAFLSFHDELMRRFYGDDEASHFDLGRQVGRYALNEKPFSSFKEKSSLADLVDSLPTLHQIYFADAATRTEAFLRDGYVEFRILQAPEKHLYFEELIVGYVSGILEMYCANPILTVRLRAGGSRDYAYRLCASTDDVRPPGGQRLVEAAQTRGHEREIKPQRHAAAPPRLSKRELDVLLLLAHGKTNKEIGAMLRISGKTAQHHVSRAYRKIGVSSRVGAALWLAGRGIAARE